VLQLTNKGEKKGNHLLFFQRRSGPPPSGYGRERGGPSPPCFCLLGQGEKERSHAKMGGREVLGGRGRDLRVAVGGRGRGDPVSVLARREKQPQLGGHPEKRKKGAPSTFPVSGKGKGGRRKGGRSAPGVVRSRPRKKRKEKRDSQADPGPVRVRRQIKKKKKREGGPAAVRRRHDAWGGRGKKGKGGTVFISGARRGGGKRSRAVPGHGHRHGRRRKKEESQLDPFSYREGGKKKQAAWTPS